MSGAGPSVLVLSKSGHSDERQIIVQAVQVCSFVSLSFVDFIFLFLIIHFILFCFILFYHFILFCLLVFIFFSFFDQLIYYYTGLLYRTQSYINTIFGQY